MSPTSSDTTTFERPRRTVGGMIVTNRQLTMALYSIVIGGAFAAGVLGVIYSAATRAEFLAHDLVENDAALDAAIASALGSTPYYVVGLALLFMVSNVVITVLYTHRLVGPVIAFRRHVRGLIDGRLDVRTTLRPNDAFSGLANDLNELTDLLARQKGAPPPTP